MSKPYTKKEIADTVKAMSIGNATELRNIYRKTASTPADRYILSCLERRAAIVGNIVPA